MKKHHIYYDENGKIDHWDKVTVEKIKGRWIMYVLWEDGCESLAMDIQDIVHESDCWKSFKELVQEVK